MLLSDRYDGHRRTEVHLTRGHVMKTNGLRNLMRRPEESCSSQMLSENSHRLDLQYFGI